MEGGSSSSGLPRDSAGREITGARLGEGPRQARRMQSKSRQVIGHEHVLGPEPELTQADVEMRDAADDNGPAAEDVPRMTGRREIKRPPRKIVEEHELTHYPFAPWCGISISSRGLNKPHRAHPDPMHRERNRVNRVHFDWAFFRDIEGGASAERAGRAGRGDE